MRLMNGMDRRHRLSGIALLLILSGPPQRFPAALGLDDLALSVDPGPQDGIAYRAGHWSIFRVTAVNREVAPRRIIAYTRLGDGPALEHGREFFLPPRSKRIAWHPIFLPDSLPVGKGEVELSTAFMDRTLGDRRRAGASGETSTGRTSIIALQTGRTATGLIADPTDAAARQLVVEMRRAQNLPDNVTAVDSDVLSAFLAGLAAFDQLVLASPSIAEDPAGMVAIRRWVEAGGQLWIMLDRVPPNVLAPLFGDDLPPEAIDRVALATLQVVDVRNVARKAGSPVLHLAAPVEMLRVVADGASEQAFEVHGWPAAFWQSAGRGRVLFTTIGLTAWAADNARVANPSANAGPGKPLAALASQFLQPRPKKGQLPKAAERMAVLQVGYSIVERRVVLAIFGVCATGLIMTTWLAVRWRRPFLLGWAAPALSILACAALLVVGAKNRTAVAPTLTNVQLIHVEPQRGDLRVASIVGAYHPRAVRTGMRGKGALIWPGAPPLAGSAGRMAWTDRDQWHLENVVLPAGVTLAHSSWDASLSNRASIKASLTSDGIEGRLDTRLFGDGSDAILFAPGSPHLAVDIRADGTFVAGPDARLEAGQFVKLQLVGARAGLRQEVYRELLATAANSPDVGPPQLYFWTSPLPSRVALGATEREVGEALASVPVNLIRPPDSTRVAIPSLLIPWETVPGPDGTPVTSSFSNADRQWVESLVAATNVTMRFQMPPASLPLVIGRATLYVEITAPSRKVSVAGWDGVTRIPLADKVSPADARMAASIDDPRALGLDSQGGLLLNIDVGRHPREEEADLATAGWHIDRVWLDVDEGTVQPRRSTPPGDP